MVKSKIIDALSDYNKPYREVLIKRAEKLYCTHVEDVEDMGDGTFHIDFEYDFDIIKKTYLLTNVN